MMIGFGGGLFTGRPPDSRDGHRPADRQRHRARSQWARSRRPPRASRSPLAASVRDGVEFLAAREMLGPVFRTAEAGYSVRLPYRNRALVLPALAAVGPLAASPAQMMPRHVAAFGP